MAFPSAAHHQLGILRALLETGGEAMRQDPSFYSLIAAYFPDIGAYDPKSWTEACEKVIDALAERRDIEDLGARLLLLTDQGQARLERRWLPEWGPNPIQPPPAPEPPPPGAETPPPGMGR